MWQIIFDFVLMFAVLFILVLIVTLIKDFIEYRRDKKPFSEWVKNNILAFIVMLCAPVLVVGISFALHYISRNAIFSLKSSEVTDCNLKFNCETINSYKIKDVGTIKEFTICQEEPTTNNFIINGLWDEQLALEDPYMGVESSTYFKLLMSSEEYDLIIGEGCTAFFSDVYVLDLEATAKLGQKIRGKFVRLSILGEEPFTESEIKEIEQDFLEYCNSLEEGRAEKMNKHAKCFSSRQSMFTRLPMKSCGILD